MKIASFPTIGTLDETLPDSDDPIFQMASLALDLHKLLKNMSDEGFVLQQAESTDYSSIDTDLDTYLSDVNTWLSNLPSSPAEGTSRGLPSTTTPSMPDIVSGVVSLALAGAGGLPTILVRIVIEFGIKLLAKWLEGRIFAGNDPAIGELIDVINELKDEITNLSTYNGKTFSESLAKGLLEGDNALMKQILSQFTINILGDDQTQTWGVEPVVS